MRQAVSTANRTKVSVTVDPALLKAVDTFVAEHPEYDRSKVFDEALYLWYAQQEERAIEDELTTPRSEIERKERAAWRRIQSAAAERILGRPE